MRQTMAKRFRAGFALGRLACAGMIMLVGCSSPPPEPPPSDAAVDLSEIETESKTTKLD
ncbi:MAG: hypothetical protein AAGJ46_05610 [Planctomycetota bacterium]